MPFLFGEIVYFRNRCWSQILESGLLTRVGHETGFYIVIIFTSTEKATFFSFPTFLTVSENFFGVMFITNWFCWFFISYLLSRTAFIFICSSAFKFIYFIICGNLHSITDSCSDRFQWMRKRWTSPSLNSIKLIDSLYFKQFFVLFDIKTSF